MTPQTNPAISPLEMTIFTATLMSMVAISIDALLPALGFISSDLLVSDPNRTQLVISALFLGMALGQLICGPYSDALGRKPVLYAGLLMYLAGTLLCYFAGDLNTLLAGRFIQGLGVAGPYISAVSLVRDQYKGRDMAKIMSLVMMIFMLVPAIAPTLGQGLLLISDWRGVFIFYIAYALIITLWIFLRLPETLPKDHRIKLTVPGFLSGFKAVITHKITMSLTICMGLLFGCFISYLNSSQQIFQEQFAVGKMFSVYFGVLALVMGVSSMVNSQLVQRLGMQFLSQSAFMAIVLASVIFLIIQLLMDINLWIFLTYIACVFFSFGLIFGNVNAMAMEPMGDNAGIASAVIGSVSSIMSIIIGTTIGQLYDGTVMPITLGFVFIGTIATGILIYVGKINKQTEQV
ncbi:multidrug effflux MFS transporter [Marinicellulosiphila megalodicopiae]|uniref:multidrug effflux MFS transporter n=1 Tax=Marinicellulosiphila megalodicopiae TaxID=2724896 RepID=UPI003BAFB48C